MRRRVADFDAAVYALVRRIPRGRVATYGQVAQLVGHPRAARAVGNALGRLSVARSRVVPWHRVRGAGGTVSRRGDGDAAALQRRLLEREGVRFSRGGRVDLRLHAWRRSDAAERRPSARS